MAKQEIQVFDYASEIAKALPQGVLLTTACRGKVNTMTIGWGTLGIVWGEPVFIAFVRMGRFTRELLDEAGEFTVNVPHGEFDKKILGYCGTHSGRDHDKIGELGLTAVPSEAVGAPGIRELPLTLECKVIYSQMQNPEAIPPEILQSMYPQAVDSSHPRANRDFHKVYYGKILKSYLIQ